MVQESMKAAEELEKDGYSVEVIDLRTVQPLDVDTLVASVEKLDVHLLFKKHNVKQVLVQQ